MISININKTDLDFTECKNLMDTLNVFINELLYHLRKHNISKIRVSAFMGATLGDSSLFQHGSIIDNVSYNANPVPYTIGKLNSIDVYVDPYLRYDDNRIYLEYDDIYIRTMKINRLLNKDHKVLLGDIILDRDLMDILIV